eukprot:9641752-Alexandrium_andersonii.AAC.1
MPSDACGRRLPKRRGVFDEGWRRKGEGLLPTLLRPRPTSQGCVVYSACQYGPQYLLFSEE